MLPTFARRHGRVIGLIALLCALTVVLSGCGGPPETVPTPAAPQAAVATPAPPAAAPVVVEATIPTNTPPAPSPDRAALVALYNATDGANWYVNDNWLSDAPLGEWLGVTIDGNGRVIELDLVHGGLTGELPGELGRLNKLTKLQLSGNKLAGEIPEELGDLANLESLSFSDNLLTGEIPAELESLIYLVNLRLSGNNLMGCVPPLLQSVPNNDLIRLGLEPCAQSQRASISPDRAALVVLYDATNGANWRDNSNLAERCSA